MTHAFDGKFESGAGGGSGDAHAGALHQDSKINSLGEFKAFCSDATHKGGAAGDSTTPPASSDASGKGGSSAGHGSSGQHHDAAHQRIVDDNKRLDALDKLASQHFKPIIK